MSYRVTSAYAGRYAHGYNGITNSFTQACIWFVKWSVLDLIRVLRLNHYHYGNVLGMGRKLTDQYGRKGLAV